MKKSGCPVGYVKTKDSRCIKTEVKKVISDKGIDHALWVKLLKKSGRGLDFNEDWGLYPNKKDADAAHRRFVKEVKTDGIPQNMYAYIEFTR